MLGLKKRPIFWAGLVSVVVALEALAVAIMQVVAVAVVGTVVVVVL